ncbi:hypothetical protein KTO58_05750 [Chitinophaga pendula]|uniref:RNA ligase family protein n=1 Tax=Chitinophaga TaxID=79328 RepID=UPI000BAFCE10|nr:MULTISPECIES: RNA ligase family protein [Chitinophaga]ASZ13694.1 2'-5' RNA ligase [Chitinophaga sp. MD30]UCJ08690.1 hypothetical protein KTO58_05750 [Chitinophaga pendula]
MTSKHAEYEKMPKRLKGLNLSEKDQHHLNKLKWVVTEKVHGANFSFVYEDRRLLYAKRKEYLSWQDDFFGFQVVAAQLEDRLIRLFEQLHHDIPGQRYIIYGELFGGAYPHPDVVPDPYVQAIQTGVYYSPAVRFCAFDIAVEWAGIKQYIDYDKALSYFERFDIFYAKVLFSGKWNEALQFDTRIDSMIPGHFGLPVLNPNLIEGIVVKPLSHSGLPAPAVRPIIKIKNPEFDEEKKFHEAEKWSFIPDVISLSEELSFLVEEMSNYITDNRLNSVLSKIGRLDEANEKRMSEIKAEFLEDVYVDFNLDNNDILGELEERNLQWVRDRIAARIEAFITSGNG